MSTSSARKRLAPAAERAAIGTDVHRLVADVLASGRRQPTPLELVETLARHRLSASGYQHAARQKLLGRAAIYFRYFAPPASWVFAGAEIKAGAARFDLSWELSGPESAYVVDELKTGRGGGTLGVSALEKQLSLYVREAGARWGTGFRGIRVIYLAAPRDSFFVTPDGERSPLSWEGCP